MRDLIAYPEENMIEARRDDVIALLSERIFRNSILGVTASVKIAFACYEVLEEEDIALMREAKEKV